MKNQFPKIIGLLVLCFTLCLAQNLSAAPTTVFAYNQPGDGFDNNAQGYIFQ